jgi:hypothetical protein
MPAPLGILILSIQSSFRRSYYHLSSNAGHQARREAEAQRTLYAVACMPWFGAGSGRDMAFSHSRMALMLRL